MYERTSSDKGELQKFNEGGATDRGYDPSESEGSLGVFDKRVEPNIGREERGVRSQVLQKKKVLTLEYPMRAGLSFLFSLVGLSISGIQDFE
jgi:hypothetical protein